MSEEPSTHQNYLEEFKQYSNDVRVEMKRVTWPGKQEVYGTTIMVVLTTFVFGIYFWLCDLVFQKTVYSLLSYFRHRS